MNVKEHAVGPLCLIGCEEDEDCTNPEYICHMGMLWHHYYNSQSYFILLTLFSMISDVL